MSAKFDTSATISGAEASLSGSAKAGVAAPSVSVTGSGTTEISGGVVKIN